jgi:hypothetical protein
MTTQRNGLYGAAASMRADDLRWAAQERRLRAATDAHAASMPECSDDRLYAGAWQALRRRLTGTAVA